MRKDLPGLPGPTAEELIPKSCRDWSMNSSLNQKIAGLKAGITAFMALTPKSSQRI